MDPFVDGLLLLFKYFRVGSLLKTLEDLHGWNGTRASVDIRIQTGLNISNGFTYAFIFGGEW
jgi:hypothetical protein